MYQKTILDNGLGLIACNMPARSSLALGIWIRAGSRYESFQQRGISHFLEHLLFKGSRKYSCKRIKESIEGVGGSLNGFTSEELTCYLAKIPAVYLELALDVLSDMVINPMLSAVEVAKEKTVVLEEIKMYKDLPQSYVYDLLGELLWPGQPLGRPVIGSEDSIAGITRKDLSLFKERYYNSSSIVVSAAGALDYKKLSKMITRIFSVLGKGNKNIFRMVRQQQDAAQLKVMVKDTEQTHMALGFHGLPRDHKLRHALGLLHVILGANMSSRLFNELREKRGLAYEIGSQVKYFQDTGAFIVHAGIDNRKVLSAIGIILKELKRARREDVSRDEFKRAKEFYLGQLRLSLEDTLDHMFWIGESTVTLNRAYSLQDIIREVEKVKRRDILRVARQIFREENLNLALIGPLKKEQERIRKRLSLV